MHVLLRAYLVLTRLVGLNNLGFNVKKQAFTKHNKPAFVYCLLLNAVYIALLPYTVSVMARDMQSRTVKSLLIHIIDFIACISVLAVLMTLVNAWWQRARICRLLNKFVRFFLKYHAEIFAPATRAIRMQAARLMLLKTVTSCCRLTIFYLYLYMQLRCSPTLSYVLSTLFVGPLETLMILVDCNIFMGLLMCNVLLGIFVQQLQVLRSDVGLLQLLERKPQQAKRHATWCKLLCAELQMLGVRKRRVQELIQTLLQIYQWQLLFALFSSFHNHVVMLFRVLMYVKDREHFEIGFFLFYVLIAVANVCNLQLLFDVCERIQQQFRVMWHLLERMLLQCTSGASGSAELLLQRNIELFLLDLQQHGMHFHILGLFELNRRTGHRLNRAVVEQLIVLVQIAVKQWY